eukprot:ANDGO_01207.mRNA.1 hypothetical protein PPTG_01343
MESTNLAEYEAAVERRQRELDAEKEKVRSLRSTSMSAEHSSLVARLDELGKQADEERRSRRMLFDEVYKMKQELRSLESNSRSVEQQMKSTDQELEVETLVMQRIMLKQMKENRKTLEKMINQREGQIQAILGIDDERRKQRDKLLATAEKIAHMEDASYITSECSAVDKDSEYGVRYTIQDDRMRKIKQDLEEEQRRVASQMKELNSQRRALFETEADLRRRKSKQLELLQQGTDSLLRQEFGDDWETASSPPRLPSNLPTVLEASRSTEDASASLHHALSRLPVPVSDFCQQFVSSVLDRMFVSQLTTEQWHCLTSRYATGQSLSTISIDMGIIIPQDYIPSDVVHQHDEALWNERDLEITQKAEATLRTRVFSYLTDMLVFKVYFKSLVASVLSAEHDQQKFIKKCAANVLFAETVDFVSLQELKVQSYEGGDLDVLFPSVLHHFQKMRDRGNSELKGLRYFGHPFVRKLQDAFAAGDKRDPLVDLKDLSFLDDNNSRLINYTAQVPEPASRITYASTVVLTSKTLLTFAECRDPCAVALSPCCGQSSRQRFLAVGTLDGFLHIQDLFLPGAPRLFSCKLAKGSVPRSIVWSFDGVSLVVIDTAHMIHRVLLLDTSSKSSESRMGEDDPESSEIQAGRKASEPPCLTMQPVYQGYFGYRDVDSDGEERDFRSTLDLEDRDPQTRKSLKKKRNSEDALIHFTLGAFHASFTMLFTPAAFLVGLSNGTFLKLNWFPSRFILCGKPPSEKAVFPVSLPSSNIRSSVTDSPMSLSLERFRGHRSGVLLVDSVSFSSWMVSVDQRGHINLWQYDRDSLSTFGWFQTEKRFRLLLDRDEYEISSQAVFTAVGSDTSEPSPSNGIARRRDAAVLEKKKTSRSKSQLLNEFNIDVSKPYARGADGSKLFVSHDGRKAHRIHCVSQGPDECRIQLHESCSASSYKLKSMLLSVALNPEKDSLVCLLYDPYRTPKLPQMTFATLSLDIVRGDVSLSSSPIFLQYDCTAESTCKFVVSRMLPGGDLILFCIFFSTSSAVASEVDVFSVKSGKHISRFPLPVPVRLADVFVLMEDTYNAADPYTMKLFISEKFGEPSKNSADANFTVLTVKVSTDSEREIMVGRV